MSERLKPTKPVNLEDVMGPMADALDDWALIREKVFEKLDIDAAREARELAAEVRRALASFQMSESLEEGESAMRKLEQLRSSALEMLAKR